MYFVLVNIYIKMKRNKLLLYVIITYQEEKSALFHAGGMETHVTK